MKARYKSHLFNYSFPASCAIKSILFLIFSFPYAHSFSNDEQSDWLFKLDTSGRKSICLIDYKQADNREDYFITITEKYFAISFKTETPVLVQKSDRVNFSVDGSPKLPIANIKDNYNIAIILNKSEIFDQMISGSSLSVTIDTESKEYHFEVGLDNFAEQFTAYEECIDHKISKG